MVLLLFLSVLACFIGAVMCIELYASGANMYTGVNDCMSECVLKQIRLVNIWGISDLVCKP